MFGRRRLAHTMVPEPSVSKRSKASRSSCICHSGIPADIPHGAGAGDELLLGAATSAVGRLTEEESSVQTLCEEGRIIVRGLPGRAATAPDFFIVEGGISLLSALRVGVGWAAQWAPAVRAQPGSRACAGECGNGQKRVFLTLRGPLTHPKPHQTSGSHWRCQLEPRLWTTPSASVLFSPHQAAKTLSFSLEPLVHGTTPDAIL